MTCFILFIFRAYDLKKGDVIIVFLVIGYSFWTSSGGMCVQCHNSRSIDKTAISDGDG